MVAAKIRAQHKRLDSLFQELSLLPSVPEGHAVLEVILEELVRLLAEHCRDEEHLMRHVGYPLLRDHELQHRTLIEQAESLQLRLQQRTLPFCDAVDGFRNIVVRHFSGCDAQMLKFCESGQSRGTLSSDR